MARLVIRDDPAAFRAEVEPFLAVHEAENNLLFGILHGIEQGRYRDPLLCFLEDAGEVAAVALMTPPRTIVLSIASEATARALADGLDSVIPGVNATVDQARAFAEAWAARTGGSFHLQMSQRIYALSRVRATDRIAGRARAAEPADRDLLTEWILDFEREAMPEADADAERVSRSIENALEDSASGLVIWEVDGTPVSFAGYGGPTPNGIRIGPVYTPPERRRLGYASACVADLSARLLGGGRRFCFLYTDLANPTSNSIYRRIGYGPVCDTATYRFTPPPDAP